MVHKALTVRLPVEHCTWIATSCKWLKKAPWTKIVFSGTSGYFLSELFFHLFCQNMKIDWFFRCLHKLFWNQRKDQQSSIFNGFCLDFLFCWKLCCAHSTKYEFPISFLFMIPNCIPLKRYSLKFVTASIFINNLEAFICRRKKFCAP